MANIEGSVLFPSMEGCPVRGGVVTSALLIEEVTIIMA
jgi:hypothetical protein